MRRTAVATMVVSGALGMLMVVSPTDAFGGKWGRWHRGGPAPDRGLQAEPGRARGAERSGRARIGGARAIGLLALGVAVAACAPTTAQHPPSASKPKASCTGFFVEHPSNWRELNPVGSLNRGDIITGKKVNRWTRSGQQVTVIRTQDGRMFSDAWMVSLDGKSVDETQRWQSQSPDCGIQPAPPAVSATARAGVELEFR